MDSIPKLYTFYKCLNLFGHPFRSVVIFKNIYSYKSTMQIGILSQLMTLITLGQNILAGYTYLV